MDTIKSFEEELYSVSPSNFNDFAIRLFRFQVENNPVYSAYVRALGRRPEQITRLAEIPFMPISFFKSHTVKTGMWSEEKVFTSSGTTGSTPSRHYVKSHQSYLKNTELSFNHFFGPIDGYHILALLPSYLEREGSSLIDMADHFIRLSGSPRSGFYLNEWDALVNNLETAGNDRKVILLGVTFALLELAERFKLDLRHCIVMETGGMKGRRRELTRHELHGFLQSRLNITAVYSEYGMTELMSQAYSLGEGLFQCPPWMKVLLRDPEDPLEVSEMRQSGGINIVDLANFATCAFIETQDLGRKQDGGYFEVLGRMDNSDIRGCNLLVG